MISADAAPALQRGYFGFLGWRGHDAALWERLRAEARERRAARTARRCILGSDADADAVRMSIENVEQAGVGEWIHVEKRALGEVVRPRGDVGLVVTNPPYGERIGAESGLSALYSELGAVLRERFNRLAGRGAHGKSAAGTQSRDLRQAHSPGEQRHARVPPVAIRAERGERTTAGRGGPGGLVRTGRCADVRQSAAQESQALGAVGRARADRMLSRL